MGMLHIVLTIFPEWQICVFLTHLLLLSKRGSGMAVLATVMQLRSDTDFSLCGVLNRMATDSYGLRTLLLRKAKLAKMSDMTEVH